MYIILLILVIVVLFFLLVGYYRVKKLEPEILSINDGIDYLTRCSDNYFNRFRDIDWKVRGVKNLDQYMEFISKSVSFPSGDKYKKILLGIEMADEYLNNLSLPWYNNRDNKRIRWRIVCIDGNKYEDGLPHTRGNVIVLPINYIDKPYLIDTLIHERIHIIQRLYKSNVLKYIDIKGYKKYKHINKTRARINPDTDDYIYKDCDGKINIAEYKENADNIKDVIYKPVPEDQRSEHPYEKMAIDIANGYKDYKYNKTLYN